MAVTWLDKLMGFVEQTPIVVLRFDDGEWERLNESRRGVNEFTIARPHDLFNHVKIPTPCLVQGRRGHDEELRFGLITSKAAITTLDSRIKVTRTLQILPQRTSGLLRLVTAKPHANNLKMKLQERSGFVSLSPKLSSHLIDRLASIKSNRGPMRVVAESILSPKRFHTTAELQEDAVRTALLAFGLTPHDPVRSLELVEGRETALARASIIEDSVIEHDARQIPGYDLVQSDLTGRAVFERDTEQLVVYTANRRPLEHCFGVDLIYLNVTKENLVMLQYKMLEPLRDDSGNTDWIYRPDRNLRSEIRRMQAFTARHTVGPNEYRLNPDVFYLKFVKRDALLGGSSIIIPLDHFLMVLRDPSFKGPKGGFRVSYDGLDGRYLRKGPFIDLIKAGYIGARAETTKQLRVLIEGILTNNRAVVAAIQERRTTP
ncbi:MAG: hypothetical protein IVW54_02475 [Candidatus Binataceae bacterium]|nr:hypothetical protein [Candidatus Binataceae bacterium]